MYISLTLFLSSPEAACKYNVRLLLHSSSRFLSSSNPFVNVSALEQAEFELHQELLLFFFLTDRTC